MAAKKFFRKLLKGLQYVPRVIVTDGLSSYRVAPRAGAVGGPPAVAVSEQPGRELASADPATRAGDEALHLAGACATVPVGVQRISPHFRPRRHLLSAAHYRQVMADRFAVWNEITGVSTTAA